MTGAGLDHLTAELMTTQAVRSVGRIDQITGGLVLVTGLEEHATFGDQLEFQNGQTGEIVGIAERHISVAIDGACHGVALNDPVIHIGRKPIAPNEYWLGRVIDPDCVPLDGAPLLSGIELRDISASAPPATQRRGLGKRLATGLCVFDTVLPVVRGQRVGLFAGSGVGKSTLLAKLAQRVEADVVVIALAGERGREVSHFVDRVLGPKGMKKTVVVAATSDQTPLRRRKAFYTAMTVAEYFRDLGLHVLLLADSMTRFAEAHREVALTSGETASLNGYPPSLPSLMASLVERSGPGTEQQGDITALFSVLVAGSDMDEPVADMLRGLLDGHIVLDRDIAERGRFPAVDVLRSVSRALPDAASPDENELITSTRRRLALYEENAVMVRAGLYETGKDTELDQAIETWPELDRFFGRNAHLGVDESFAELRRALDPSSDQS